MTPKPTLPPDVTPTGEASHDGAALGRLSEQTAKLAEGTAAAVAKDLKTQTPKWARNVPAPMPAIDTEQRDAMLAAARALGAEKRAALNRTRENRADDAGLVRYVECQQCYSPGIWVHGGIEGGLGPNDWDSAYKPRGMEWPPSQVPHCQVCGKGSRLRMFQVLSGAPGILDEPQIPVGIACNPRFVRSIDRSAYDQLVAQGGKQ